MFSILVPTREDVGTGWLVRVTERIDSVAGHVYRAIALPAAVRPLQG
ncbi:hypothetical protein [Spirosoma jeollabukense]